MANETKYPENAARSDVAYVHAAAAATGAEGRTAVADGLTPQDTRNLVEERLTKAEEERQQNRSDILANQRAQDIRQVAEELHVQRVAAGARPVAAPAPSPFAGPEAPQDNQRPSRDPRPQDMSAPAGLQPQEGGAKLRPASQGGAQDHGPAGDADRTVTTPPPGAKR